MMMKDVEITQRRKNLGCILDFLGYQASIACSTVLAAVESYGAQRRCHWKNTENDHIDGRKT